MDQSLVMTKNCQLPKGVKTYFTPSDELRVLRDREGRRAASQPDRLVLEWDSRSDREVNLSDQAEI
jgi:hypothetical protein